MAYDGLVWTQSVSNTTLTKINGLTDGLHTLLSGSTDFVVPAVKNKIIFAYGVGANLTRVQIQTPSLLGRVPLEVRPVDAAATPSFPTPKLLSNLNPIHVTAGEPISALTTSGVAAQQSVLVGLNDGPITPITSSEMYTVRATGTTTLTANAWTNVTLTLDQNLPVGTFQLVGLRVESAGAIFARPFVLGQFERPPIIANKNGNQMDYDPFRYGRMGVMGQFTNIAIPTIDIMSSSADTSETILMDVIQVS